MCRRNQLAQDAANCSLKSVPATGQSQAGKAPVEFRKQRNCCEAIRNEHGIQVQVEHFPDTTDDLKKTCWVLCDKFQIELRQARDGLNPETADRTADRENSFEKTFSGPLHTRHQVRLVKLRDGLPIVGRPERKL